jgi:hypothetical protein
MVGMLRKAAALAVATAVLPLAAAPALARGVSHTMIPYRSLGGVQLKWTPSQVKRRLGRPDAVFHEQGRISGYEYDAAELQVNFDVEQKQDRAFLIGVTGGPYHTIKGIRIGTSEKTLKRKLRGYQHFSCTKNVGCTISKSADIAEPGTSTTSFGVSRGKVQGFSIGYTFSTG